MEIFADGKNIPTYAFSGLFRQGEKFADTITIITERFYGGNDLSHCSFLMRGINENGGEAQQVIVPDISDYSLIFSWNVSESFTAVSGELKLELRASVTDSGGESRLILKFGMEPVFVAESPKGENLPIPDAAEQIISEIADAASSALEKISDSSAQAAADITSAAASGKAQIENIISEFDISAVEERLDDMDSDIAVFLSRPEVIPMTAAQYASVTPKQNSLYVIIKE
ncbi:MAG: hypothetical protein ACI4JE_05745 [Ruminococcus sp.]